MSQVFPINADPRYRIYTAEAGQVAFAVPFPWQDNDDITILRTDLDGVTTTLNEAEHYQLTGAGNVGGGTMTLNEGEEALEGEEFLILGDASLVRVSSIVQGGRFRYRGTDNDLDRLTIIAQEIHRELGRTLHTAYGVAGAEVEVGGDNRIPLWWQGKLIPGPLWGEGLGVPGPGLPPGGLPGQVPVRIPGPDFTTEWQTPASSAVTFDPTGTGLSSDDVQAAIEELDARVALEDGDKGDIEVSAGGSVWSIGTNVLSSFWRSIIDTANASLSWLQLQVLGHLATVAALKALTPQSGMSVQVSESGRAGLFVWNGADLSSLLVIDSQTTTSVDAGTDLLTKAGHGYLRGEALVAGSSVNGLVAGTVYYAIRSGTDTFKLATTWANAMAGVAINLTGSTNLTFSKLRDPLEGVYVVKTGDDRRGTNGAWVRVGDHLTADIFGAKRDGVTDDCQALNAAALFASTMGMTLHLPGGDYLINTSTPSSYEARAIGRYNITIQSQDGWRIVGDHNTRLVMGTTGNYAHMLFIMDCADFEISGIEFVGNNTGLGGSDNNGALFPYSCNNFSVHDIKTSVFQGSHIVGNFWFNFDFSRIYQSIPSNASGFDCASIQNGTVRRQYAVGAGLGTGQGFQHSFDTPNDNPAFNTTGIALRDDLSNNFRIQDGDYSGFATGVAVFEAVEFWIEGNAFRDNKKASGDGIYGVLISPMDSAPIWGATVRNNKFYRNGTLTGTAGVRGGLLLNSNIAAVHAEVTGNQFYDNQPAGIAVFGAATFIRGIEDNDFGNIVGGDQTLSWSGNPLLASKTREVADAATNSISAAQRLSHSTSATAAAGFGVAQEFEVESGAGTRRIGARVDARLNTPTDGAEDVSLDFNVMKAGTLRRFFRMLQSGLFTIGDTAIAGIDFGFQVQSAFPQSWQFNVSAANGEIYFYDQTNGKFPIRVARNIPDASFVASALSTISLLTSSTGALNAEQISILSADRAGSDVATAQAIFGASEDALTVAANVTYEFEAQIVITRAAGTNSHTTAFLLGGTATFTSCDMLIESSNPTGNVLSAKSEIQASSAAGAVATAANTSATENVRLTVRGTMRVNGAGTVIPQFQFSAAPGGAPTIKRNSFFRCWPIGTDTLTKVGNWA